VTTDDVAEQSARIYQLLQTNVDEQILHTGFVPPTTYGMEVAPASANGKHSPNGHAQNGNHWKCSDKQKDLILKLVEEHSLDKDEVDHLARQRFGKGVRMLNKVEASGLIDELLDTYGGWIRPYTPRFRHFTWRAGVSATIPRKPRPQRMRKHSAISNATKAL